MLDSQDKQDGKEGFAGAIRYVARHSPASLSIALLATISLYLLDRGFANIPNLLGFN